MMQSTATSPIKKVRYFINEKKEGMSSSITQNWTDQAIRCYYNNCDCSKCSISQANYSFECQMSSVVKVLLNELGPPDRDRIWKSIIRAS